MDRKQLGDARLGLHGEGDEGADDDAEGNFGSGGLLEAEEEGIQVGVLSAGDDEAFGNGR